MDTNIKNEDPDKARKRSNIKTQQKKAEKKRKLYSGDGLPKKPICKHNSKSLKCLLLANQDLFYFHKRLHDNISKTEQDNYILKHIFVTKVKRYRPRKGSKNPRAFNIKFYIPKYKTKELIPVCKKTFLLASRLKPSRINGVAKRHYETGSLAKENRGGDRKQFTFASRKEAVEKFIKSFTPLESHYCRDQIKVRQYLHPDLNIKKMFQMYEDQVLPGFSVTQGFFRKIFNTRFNIGFGSPRTDVCSTCLQLTEKIKMEKIRLVSDGCGGQNKNSMVICMIMKWLLESPANIKEVEMLFPVTGHSFLPADRVFALNERTVKKIENIIKPSDYENIISEHATIHKLATEIPVYDWKDKSKDFLKNTQSWHFQISKYKRIIFQKGNRNTVNVRGEVSYRNDICNNKSLTKRGKRLNELSLVIIPAGVSVKAAKLNDVKNLLRKHYGDEWQKNENLSYYKNILTRLDSSIMTNDSDNESFVDPGDIENEEITDFV